MNLPTRWKTVVDVYDCTFCVINPIRCEKSTEGSDKYTSTTVFHRVGKFCSWVWDQILAEQLEFLPGV
jgi:hypothetical protein